MLTTALHTDDTVNLDNRTHKRSSGVWSSLMQTPGYRFLVYSIVWVSTKQIWLLSSCGATVLIYLLDNIPVFFYRRTAKTTSNETPTTHMNSLICFANSGKNTVGDVEFSGNIFYLSPFFKLSKNIVMVKLSVLLSVMNILAFKVVNIFLS